MTEYGRQLSKEILSTKGNDGESDFAYGAVKLPPWLNMGGDFRTLGFYENTSTFEKGRFFQMQTDLETSMTYQKIQVTGTLGYQDTPPGQPGIDHLISRRHFVGYRPTDELSFRGGRFMPAYGINTPDHVISTKRGLGWDEGSETYNVEAAWIGERFNIFGTGIFGRPDSPSLNREKGAALTVSSSLGDTYKVGASYFNGTSNIANRQVVGPWGILGFSPHFFLLTELDYQASDPNAASQPTQRGIVNYQRLDYEFFQGFHGYLTQELSRLDFTNSDGLNKTYGLGIQSFPRPHLEVNLSIQLQSMATVPGYNDIAVIMLHFYP